MTAHRPMQRGELFACEYRLTSTPTTMPSFRLLRAVSNTMKTLTMVIRFHPDAQPVSVRAGIQASMDDDDVPADTVDVPISAGEAQHVDRPQAGRLLDAVEMGVAPTAAAHPASAS